MSAYPKEPAVLGDMPLLKDPRTSVERAQRGLFAAMKYGYLTNQRSEADALADELNQQDAVLGLVADMVADVFHLAHFHGVDAAWLVERARLHFDEEVDA